MKHILVSLEGRIEIGPDMQLRTRAPHAHASFWADLVHQGARIHILGRVSRTSLPGAELLAENFVVHPIPEIGRLRNWPALLGALFRLRHLFRKLDVVTFVRLPGLVGFVVGFMSFVHRRPLLVHIVGDPREAGLAAAPRWTGRVVAYLFFRATRILAKRSTAAFYVNPEDLARIYPPSEGAIAYRKRNVNLLRIKTIPQPKVDFRDKLVIFTAGTHEQMYKGHDVLIQAASALTARGRDVVVRIAGDGRYHSALEQMAAEIRPRPVVEFLGHLAGSESLQQEMQHADLFVLPSRTEGYPRVLVEAMALGLPCLATSVGAVSELLPQELLVPPDDPLAIADAVERFIGARKLLASAASACHRIGIQQLEEQRRDDQLFARILAETMNLSTPLTR